MGIDEFLKEVFELLASFVWTELPWGEFRQTYRRRTLQEILQNKYFLGCYEPALVFYERAREEEFSVRFLEMISLESRVDKDGEEHIRAHCFVELVTAGRKSLVDPTQREILLKLPSDMVLFSEGADRWTSFDDFHEAQKRFVENGFKW